MSTLTPSTALQGLPKGLRDELLKAYGEISRNFREGRWEPAELNGGKLCEIVYTILRGYTTGKYPSKASKPSNMVDACTALAQAGSQFPRSIRIQIPRMLIALYEIRSNRNVAHTGGDVDPSHMDAVVVFEMSRWLVAELVRVFHNLTPDGAGAIVDSLVERVVPVVWEVGGKKRVLETGLATTDKALLLLYNSVGSIEVEALREWLEYKNPSHFRARILAPAHKSKLIEFDDRLGRVQLSPKGVSRVEKELLGAAHQLSEKSS